MIDIYITLSTLGIIQGITEFLPISSSGHLVLFEKISYFKKSLDSAGGESLLFINVILHIATLMAILIYFRKDITTIIRGTLQGVANNDFKRSELHCFINIIVATIPAGIIGLLFHDFFETLCSSHISVCLMLIINGFILLSTKIIPLNNRKLGEIGFMRSIFIGCCQAFAIMPGISRSGTTITGGMISGLNPEESARFSFLMAIPTIAGAGLMEILRISKGNIPSELILPLLFAMILTMIIALISLKLLFSLIRIKKIAFFGYYTISVGVVILLFTILI